MHCLHPKSCIFPGKKKSIKGALKGEMMKNNATTSSIKLIFPKRVHILPSCTKYFLIKVSKNSDQTYQWQKIYNQTVDCKTVSF